MRTRLDRYVLGQLAQPAILGLGFYTFVMVMNQLFLAVKQAFQRSADPSLVGQLILLALPKILVLTIPMALLFGLLIGLGRLSADSEIIAMRAAGLSYVRLARPIVALGLIGFLLSAFIYNIVVPWSSSRIEAIRVSLLRSADPNREIQAGVFFDDIPDTVVYAEAVDRNDAEWPLRNVLIETERLAASPARGSEPDSAGAGTGDESTDEPPPGSSGAASESGESQSTSPGIPVARQTLIFGSRGRIELARNGSEARLFVDRGEIHQTEAANPDLYRRIQFERPFMAVVPILLSTQPGAERPRLVQEYTLSELIAEARHFKPRRANANPERVYRYRRDTMEIHWRFAVPAACFAFCMLGFPLGLLNQRGGKSSGFAISLLVIVGYWIALTSGRDLALEGKIPLFLGAWGPDLLLLAVGLVLILKRQRADELSFSFPSRIASWLRSAQGWLAGGLRRAESTRRPQAPALALPPRSRLSVIDRYVVRRFLGVFGLVLVSAASLYGVVEIRGLVDSLIDKPFPVRLALAYLAYLGPGTLKLLLPIAAVVAALITIGLICRANEDTALKAAGVSIFRIAAPMFVATIGLCVLYFIIQDYVAPTTNQSAGRIRDQIEGRVASSTLGGTRWFLGKDHRLYSYDDYDPESQVLQGVSVLELKENPFRVRRRLWSPKVRWKEGAWTAFGGWVRDFPAGTDAPTAPIGTGALKWREEPEDFARQERSLVQSSRLAEEMSFWALRDHIRRMRASGYDTSRLRVSLYEKLAFPCAPLVMVMIGVPFAFRAGRRGSLYGMGIALVLVIAYWACFAFSSALGQEQVLPPLLAAWAPNLLFGFAGGYLFLSTRS